MTLLFGVIHDFGVVVFTIFFLYMTSCCTQPFEELYKVKYWKYKFFLEREEIKKKSDVKISKEQRVIEVHDDENMTRIAEITPELTEKELENEKKKDNILEEILQTEEDYVDHLTTLIENFKKPIKEKNILTESQQSTLFGNIDVVYGVNVLFLKNLKEALKHPHKEEKMAEMISKFSKSFRLYTSYISNYEKSALFLRNESKTNIKLTSFLKEISKTLTGRRIVEISSLLILPIQRLMRYKMLLDDLYKRIHNNSAKQKLKVAIEEVSEVAIYCNDKQTEYEQMTRMIELTHSIPSFKNLIQPSRKFIKEDDTVQQCDSSKKYPIQLFLFNDLLVFVRKQSSLGVKTTKQIDMKSILSVGEVPKDRYVDSFYVVYSSGTLEFSCKTKESCNSWIKSINGCINDYNETIMSPRKSKKSK
eukprot:gene3843-7003_t